MENEQTENELFVEDGKESCNAMILEEITIEELAVDGICGVY